MLEATLLSRPSGSEVVPDISEYESSSEEIDRVISNIQITENFAFYDSMELVEI